VSANLVVDLGATCDYRASVSVGSGSDFAVGQIVDLLGANTMCQLYVAGALFGSGAIEVRVQTSDSVTSGTFTDPTSGLAALPTTLVSGGVFFANSGLWASGYSSLSAPVNNAPLFCSGGIQFAAFQRPHRYARLVYNSGVYLNPITAGFISNKKTTGSGAGFTYAPGSGSVNV
jgi:hypothetical protein